MGRIHRHKWGPREIDVDILAYGQTIIQDPDLIIPHPEVQNRQFVLIPFAEIAPDFTLPSRRKTISQLLKENIILQGAEKITVHLSKPNIKYAIT